MVCNHLSVKVFTHMLLSADVRVGFVTRVGIYNNSLVTSFRPTTSSPLATFLE